MSELDITVSTLVQVHEVHVDLIPGNLSVILRMEGEQRFLQCLQTLDPHLCGRERMHPCDDTHALRIIVSGLHHFLHFLGAVGRTFIYYFNRDDTAGVQAFHHLLGVTVNSNDCVTSV